MIFINLCKQNNILHYFYVIYKKEIAMYTLIKYLIVNIAKL